MTPRAGAALLAFSLGAGLVTGLARFPDPIALRVAVSAAALVDRRPSTLTLAASALLGHFGGQALHVQDGDNCAAHLSLGERTFRLRLLDPGSGTGRAVPLGADCTGAVRVRWPRDTVLAAGALVDVRARWTPREGRLGSPDGLLIVRTIVRVEPGGGWVAASRTAVHRTIRDLFGARAGLVDALVTGRSSEIPVEVRERFAASGLVHILSISGFHMSLIGFWLLLGLGLAGVPGHRSRPIAALAVLAYAAWLGWPPPATRAAALFAILVVARWRQRALRPDGVLGASALVVLAIDPRAVIDLGAWLSFAAMAGVLGASRWYRRQVETPNAVVEGVLASVGATLTTAPIAALTIGRVAAIGPLINLPAIPLAAAAMPVLLAALAFTPIVPPIGHAFAAITSVLLAALDRVAAVGASLPGAAGASSPGWQAAAPWCALLVLAWQATAGNASWRESLRRCAWGGVVFVWWPLVLAVPSLTARDGTLRIAFLDVGQGDAAAIRTPNGRWIVIDAGPSSPTWDAGARVVAPWVRRQGGRAIDLLVVSHAHRDHFGGVASVVEALPVGLVIEPGEPVEDSAYFAMLATLATHHVRWRHVASGQEIVIDGVQLEVLSPGPSRTGDLNEDSVVLLLRYGEFTALFTGDAGAQTEPAWGKEPIGADLLKVGHHGSATATTTALLRALDPDAAVISLGRNAYGHPAPSTLARLRAAGIRPWRTDLEGTVNVESDGRTFVVRGAGRVAHHDARDPTTETSSCCTPRR